MGTKLLVALLFCSVIDISGGSLELSRFLQQLNVVTHQLGYDMMNEAFNTMNVTTKPLDGESLLEKLSVAVETKFNATKEALLNLRASTNIHNVTKSTREFRKEKRLIKHPSFPECCSVPENVNNLDGRLKNVLHDGCIFTSHYADTKHGQLIPDKISKVMKDNMENNKDLKWQYVALANGSLFLYPARQLDDCKAFDARNRSWFVEASTVHSKDVVIVLDISGSMELTNSMGKSLMNIAKTGAKMVVNTLNSKDKVGVVAFSDDIIIPKNYHCFSSQLAAATPQNKRCLNRFIDTLQGRGLTNYMAGLKKAFEYFRNTNSAIHRDRVLLFLSDGMPTSGGGREEILKLVRDEAAHLNNSIIILTFGIGKALQDDNNRQLLMDMANYTEDSSHYNHPRGHFTAVKCSNDMRQSIADYYVYMHSYQEAVEPVFTLPYFDAGRLGYVMSMCLPLQSAGKFLGVTCTDIKISDLLDDVINFRHGELSYAFLINLNGQVVFHPLLPKPLSLNQDVGLIDIESLERDTSAQQVIASMKRGEYGHKSLLSQRTVSRGASQDGIHVLWVNSTYYWAPVRGNNFSVCIVITSHDQRLTFPNEPVQSFLYHDFMKQNYALSKICKRSSRLEARDSTVKFPPNAFRNSLEYKNDNETAQNISAIKNYMEGKTNSSDIFEDGIRGSVSFTVIVGKFWSTNEYDHSKDRIPFIWRYITTIDGVLLTYPGVYINKLYDARQRPWFKRTMNNKGKLVFSRPYKDSWGAGFVMTISKAICKDVCSPYDNDNSVAAVIAADLSVDYFHEMIIQSLPACRTHYKCFVIDNSGYIVFSDNFIFPQNGKVPIIDSIHITVTEQEIANRLIKENILHARGCINVATFQNKYFWEITENAHQMHQIDGFSLYVVDDTNIFIIVKEMVDSGQDTSLPPPCEAVKSYIEEQVTERNISCREIRRSGIITDCSCTSPTDFNYCENTFDILKLSDMWSTCIPDNHRINMSNTEEDITNITVKSCSKMECEELDTQKRCRTMGCKWCIFDPNGNYFTRSFCSNDSACQSSPFIDIEPTPDTSIEELSEDNTNAITVGTSICVVIVVVLGILVFCCRRKYRQRQNDDRSKLIGNQVRVSMAELGKDNTSMLWSGVFGDALSGSSLPVINEDIPLERMQQSSRVSSSSSSIHYLAQKVEALVHRLESQDSNKSSGMTNPSFSKPLFPSTSELVYRYRSSSQSDISRPSSFHYSLPRTISNSSVLSSPKSSSLPSSNGNKISRTPSSDSAFRNTLPYDDQVVILRPKPGRLRKMLNTLRRSASEQTWPGDLPIHPNGISGDREPSERTCPASVTSSIAWPREREALQNSCRFDEEAEWNDADEAHASQTSIQKESLSRTSSFRHRSASRSSPRIRTSRRGRSRSLPSTQLAGEAAIKSFIRQCMQEVEDERNATVVPGINQGSTQSIASCLSSAKDTIIAIPFDGVVTVEQPDNVLGKEKVN